MTAPLDGVRVVEVAAWTFVPAAGAALADLGADVVKVEPLTGDPQRGLVNYLNLGGEGPNAFVEIPNRSKRSIGVDLSSTGGRDVLDRLIRRSDVFLTSYLPATRAKLHLEIDDVRAVNPDIVYVRGTGWGSKGPMREARGYDLAAAWASGTIAYHLTPPGGDPPVQPPAFYDLIGASIIAGAIGTALFRRERTGEAPVVDVSLLNVGMWSMGPTIVSAPYGDAPPMSTDRTKAFNPLVSWYPTADDRWLYLVLLDPDRYWAELCDHIGRPELADDPRFADAEARFEHRGECVAELDTAFREHTLDEWRARLRTFSGVWAPVQSPREAHEHPQIEPNGYLPRVQAADGSEFRLVAPPMQFDEDPPAPRGPAPEVGQQTEEILLELGLGWDEIVAYKDAGAIT